MIRLGTLGPLSLRGSDGVEFAAVLAQPRRVALLAYLALGARRGPQQRDPLLALFWPERDEESARNALNQALHFLRRHLGAETFVARSASEIGIAPDALWCDAVAFEDALDAGRASDAHHLWHGELLDGFHIAEAPEFQRWLESERSRLAARYAHAIEMIAKEHEAAGDAAGAVPWWRQLAARDPLSSRNAVHLMQALAAAGDPAAAVQHARVHEMLLREELGVAPTPDVVALVRKIQSTSAADRTPAAVGPARANVPIPVSDRADVGADVTASDTMADRRDGDTGPELTAAPNRVPSGRTSRAAWRRRSTLTVVGFVVLLVFGRSAGSGESNREILRRLYLRGQQAEMSRSLVGLQTARAAYELALRHDSTYALAYAGLSAVHYFMADYGYSPVAPALDSARRMALRAVALDSTAPETRTARAVTLGTSRDFDAAEREFRRAIALGPDNARAHYWYAVMLVALGRGKEALAEATVAQELDPLPPRGLTAMKRYAEWLVTGERRYLDSAVTARRPILELEPGEPWARSREAAELAQVGRCTEAREQIMAARRLVPDDNFRMFPAVIEVHWHCGEEQRARQLLAAMKQLPGVEDHGYRVALVHVLFDEPESAFDWIGHQRWTLGQLSGLSADQNVDPLRSDPRFGELLRDVGVRD